MSYHADRGFRTFLSYCFGTGGSILTVLKDIQFNSSTMGLEIDTMEQKGSPIIMTCNEEGKVKKVKFDMGEWF
jgi:hypothetical protein